MFKVNKFFIPYIILLVLLGFKGELLLAFLVAIMHEGVHYLTAVCFGYSGFDMEILPIGMVLKLDNLDEATPWQDFIISLSGPLFNLVAALIFCILSRVYSSTYLDLLFRGNLALGLFNLIPAFPLDGGRILRDFLSRKMLYKKANRITIAISVAIGIMLMLYYIYSFFRGESSFNIGIIALFIIVTSMKEKERIVYLIMGDIIKKKNKFMKKGFIENSNISVYYRSYLINALSIVDKNKYSIFTILDDEMRVMDIIYEDELVEGLKLYGNIVIEEFIKIRENNL